MIMKRTTNDKSAKLKVYSRVQSIGLALCMLVAGIVAVPSAYASGSHHSGQEESGTKEGKMPLADSLKATDDSTAIIAVSNGSHQQAANGSDTGVLSGTKSGSGSTVFAHSPAGLLFNAELNPERDRMKAISEAEKFNFEIKFPWDKYSLNPDYLTNRVAFDSLRSVLATLRVEDSVQVVVTGQASPEGTVAHNDMLSRRRAQAIERYVRDNYEGAVIETRVRTAADSWQMLREFVVKDRKLSQEKKDKVLRIIDDPKISYDTKNWRMSHTLGSQPGVGDIYAYLYRAYYKHIRRSNISLERMNPVEVFAIPPVAAFYSDAEAPAGEMAPRRIFAEPEPVNKRTIVALKTNMLYDLATVLNFAVEVPFNEKFSVLYEHHCPWWLTPNNRYCLEYLSFGGEMRWWFAPKTRPETESRKLRDALMGHYLGLYAFGGKSDIQANTFGCYQTEPFSVGLSYGYAMPISKYLNLEFSISAGYARIPYQHYIPTPDWEILIRDRDKAGVLHYFGPTKAEISLVIPFRVETGKKGGRK